MAGIGPRDNANNEGHPPAPVTSNETKTIGTCNAEPDPYARGRERRERWKFGIEIVAFLILIFGAIVGYIQVFAMYMTKFGQQRLTQFCGYWEGLTITVCPTGNDIQ